MLKDQNDLLSVFNAHNVRYLVVGGHAVNIYTQPRSTKDLDVWVDASEENSLRVFRALAVYGAPLTGMRPEDFQTESTNYFQIGVEPARIDVLHRLSGVEFEQAWEDSVPGTVEDIPVRFISLEHLIANKLASGRLRDLADADELTKFAREKK